MRSEFFSETTVDPERVERIARRAPATKTYVIYFTPRSGSSWLTDVLQQTRQLGAATEAFNPNFIPNIARSIGAVDATSYHELLGRRFQTNGVNGFEITAHQLRRVFAQPDDFFALYGGCRSFWLLREDIVAQAISLAKMVATSVTHSPLHSEEERASTDAAFRYNRRNVMHWLEHILDAERQTEAWFERYGISPLRLSYERIMAAGPRAIANAVAQRVGVSLSKDCEIVARHTKLGTTKNTEFAERFRVDYGRRLAVIDAARAPYLTLLSDLGPGARSDGKLTT